MNECNVVFSTRNAWAASFFVEDSRSDLYRISEHDDTALFMSKPKIHAEHHPLMLDMHPPTYHVWRGNSWLYCGPNLNYASELYERILHGGEKDV